MIQPRLATALALILALLVAPAAWAQSAGEGNRVRLDWIAAVVNNDVVVNSELMERARIVASELRERGQNLPPEDAFLRQVLERMIMERLQLQLAEQTGIRVDDQSLNNTVRQIARSNDATVAELRELLEQDGFSFEKFREQLRTDIILKQLRTRQVESRIRVTDHEIDALLATEGEKGLNPNAEYHLLHILVAVPEAATPDQIQAGRARAEGILADLRTGADFRAVAAERSDGQNALEGGDIGWRKLGQLPTIFVDIVASMHTGDVSDLIRSPSGFHIVKVEEGAEEQKHFVTQTKVRHILIKTDELNNDDQVRRRLEDLRDRIEHGEDFATLAKSHSQDPGSAINGGELGWSDPGTFVTNFAETMDATEIGEVSEPFQSKFGWHILQVEDRRQHDSTDQFKRGKARELIRKRKLTEEEHMWLRRMRDEAYVEYRL